MRSVGKLDKQNWMQSTDVIRVISSLSNNNNIVRFVGGCVRDSILELEIKEIDLATSAKPEEVCLMLTSSGMKPILTGISHGTVSVVSGKYKFEITTLRADIETSGRHARVSFIEDWIEDSYRRDFTFNAIYADPDGTLYDPTGGFSDLKDGIVRFIGDPSLRISEDHLRILRYFRFFGHFSKKVADHSALEACKIHASSLLKISPERIIKELLSIMSCPDPASVLKLMAEADVLQKFLPEATQFDLLTRLTRIDAADPDPLRRISITLKANKTEVNNRLKLLRLPAKQSERILEIINIQFLYHEFDEKLLSKTFYKEGKIKFIDIVYCSWAQGEPRYDSKWQKILSFYSDFSIPKFPLIGSDVLILGFNGPEVGKLLQEVRDWWVQENFIPDREGCLYKLEEISRQGI